MPYFVVPFYTNCPKITNIANINSSLYKNVENILNIKQNNFLSEYRLIS